MIFDAQGPRRPFGGGVRAAALTASAALACPAMAQTEAGGGASYGGALGLLALAVIGGGVLIAVLRLFTGGDAQGDDERDIGALVHDDFGDGAD